MPCCNKNRGDRRKVGFAEGLWWSEEVLATGHGGGGGGGSGSGGCRGSGGYVQPQTQSPAVPVEEVKVEETETPTTTPNLPGQPTTEVELSSEAQPEPEQIASKSKTSKHIGYNTFDTGNEKLALIPFEQKKKCFCRVSLTFLVMVSGFLFGYFTGVVSGSMLLIQPYFHIGMLTAQLIVSATVGTAALTSSGAEFIADFCGRKPIILFAAILFASGAVVMGEAESIVVIVVGRVIVGLAMGLSTVVVVLYVKESALSIRLKWLLGWLQLMYTIGNLVSNFLTMVLHYIGDELVWKYLLGLGAIPAILQFIAMLILPESPRWLMECDDEEGAREGLMLLRGTDMVEEELEAIRVDVEEERKELDKDDSDDTWDILGDILDEVEDELLSDSEEERQEAGAKNKAKNRKGTDGKKLGDLNNAFKGDGSGNGNGNKEKGGSGGVDGKNNGLSDMENPNSISGNPDHAENGSDKNNPNSPIGNPGNTGNKSKADKNNPNTRNPGNGENILNSTGENPGQNGNRGNQGHGGNVGNPGNGGNVGNPADGGKPGHGGNGLNLGHGENDGNPGHGVNGRNSGHGGNGGNTGHGGNGGNPRHGGNGGNLGHDGSDGDTVHGGNSGNTGYGGNGGNPGHGNGSKPSHVGNDSQSTSENPGHIGNDSKSTAENSGHSGNGPYATGENPGHGGKNSNSTGGNPGHGENDSNTDKNNPDPSVGNHAGNGSNSDKHDPNSTGGNPGHDRNSMNSDKNNSTGEKAGPSGSGSSKSSEGNRANKNSKKKSKGLKAGQKQKVTRSDYEKLEGGKAPKGSMSSKPPIIRIWLKPKVRQSAMNVSFLHLFQQLSGISCIILYGGSMILLSGLPTSLTLILLNIPNGLYVLATFLSNKFEPMKDDRRQLLMSSFFGVFIGMALIATGYQLLELYPRPVSVYEQDSMFGLKNVDDYFGYCNHSYYQTCQMCIYTEFCGFCYSNWYDGSCLPTDLNNSLRSVVGRCSQSNVADPHYRFIHKDCPNDFGWFVIVGMSVFVLAYAPGLGQITQRENSERCPVWARKTSNSIARSINWGANLLISMTFLLLMMGITKYGTCWMFTALCLIGLIYTAALLPDE